MTPQIVKRSWRDLKPPRRDARRSRDPEAFARIEGDILRRGIRTPLFIKPDGEVIAGETRRQVAVKHQIEDVPCIVREGELTPLELMTEQLQENECRADFTPMEKAEQYQAIMKAGNMTVGELAAHLGHKNASLVVKTLSLKSLPEELQAHVHSGELGWSAAYEISRLKDVPTQIDLARKVMQGLLKRDSVQEHVRGLLGGRKPKAPGPVKARTGKGLVAILPPLDHDGVLAELAAVTDAVRRAKNHGLPVASVPQLLRA